MEAPAGSPLPPFCELLLSVAVADELILFSAGVAESCELYIAAKLPEFGAAAFIRPEALAPEFVAGPLGIELSMAKVTIRFSVCKTCSLHMDAPDSPVSMSIRNRVVREQLLWNQVSSDFADEEAEEAECWSWATTAETRHILATLQVVASQKEEIVEFPLLTARGVALVVA